MFMKQILEIVLASLLALFLAGFIRIFFFDTYIVSNKSMEPTFYEGDQILLLKNNFLFNKIDNFDVIVFRMGTNNLVKRVIGKEGDKVEIFDGGLYLNDELIRHKYYIFSKEDNAVYNIGKNQYFVLGDNIALSEDSRDFGLINKKDIIGHIILIFSPKRRFKLF
ncbi:signal peptidase I [uncultured Brachyspira sp.]|uniref:signal peptidase I n=1 Tax=uncultured Brachyspira sp. TaxID=221953 RepID=UPI0034579871